MGLLTITSGSVQEYSSASLSILGNSTGSSAKPSDIAFNTDGGVLWRSGSSLVTSLLAKLGTVTTGTWNASAIGADYGGTGVSNNSANTITFSGNYGLTLTLSGTTSITLPTSGTLVNGGGSCSGTCSGTNTGDQTSISGNAGTATTLQTTRTLWGQNFNGSANVTGRLSSVIPSGGTATGNAVLDATQVVVIDSTAAAIIEFFAEAGETASHAIIWSDDVRNRGWIDYIHNTDSLGLGAGGNSTFYVLGTGIETYGTSLVSSASTTALCVGANGTTNPAFCIDASTASSATGLKIASAAAGSGVSLSVISSGTNEDLNVSGKGTGGIVSPSRVTLNGTPADGILLLIGETTERPRSRLSRVISSVNKMFEQTIASNGVWELACYSAGSVTGVPIRVAAGCTLDDVIFIDSSGNMGHATQTPDAKHDILTAGGTHMRYTYTDASVYVDHLCDSSGRLVITPTSGTQRVRKDASNYLDITVSAAGTVTFDAVGSSAGFVFSDAAQFINSSGIKILDTNASHTLGFVGGSDLTANRTYTITTGDQSVTLFHGSTTCGVDNVIDMLDISMGVPTSSNGMGFTTRNGHPVATADATTDESIVFRRFMPPKYAGGNINVDIYWSAASATSGSCRFQVQFEADDSQDIDSDSFATAQSAGGTANGTSGVKTKTTVAFTSSQIDGVTAGTMYRLKVTRDADGTSGTDDMTGDAEIWYIVISNG